MAPKKRRNIDYDDGVVYRPQKPPTPSNTTIERHTHYEDRQKEDMMLTVTSVLLNVSAQSTAHSTDYDMEPPAHEHEAEGFNSSHDVDFDHDDDTDQNLEHEAIGLKTQTAKKNRPESDNPLLMWTPLIDEYVAEFLRLEGRGDAATQSVCAGADCSTPMEKYGFRCRDCFSFQLYCEECMVHIHKTNPLHSIQKWNGTYFEKVSLKEMGLIIQLGHGEFEFCPIPVKASKSNFVIVDSDGIHSVALYYCGCNPIPKYTQLLRARLFPSTVVDPQTAVTFRVLETFQMLSFNSKISAYEFYNSLARRTDNTGLNAPVDRYHVFLRVVREWRHIRLLKRMARGHAASGVRGTAEGECAVICPACPHPGINLPPDWRQRPEKDQWLYTLFLSKDANFRMKRLNVSSDARDPGLNHGYAYVVEEEKFKKYLAEYSDLIPDDKSTCNNHDAIKSASMRGGHGTAATGVGTADCSRHDMKRPSAVGDLQKGERYVNMDYFFLSSLQGDDIPQRLMVSYDIACQWSKNLMTRAQLYPLNALTRHQLELRFLVPKFHLPAHIKHCQINYSFNLMPFVGRTDGEPPERLWSLINPIATSTKEMGPGSRRDTLDDHFGDYNWRKVFQLGEILKARAEDAIKNRREHIDAFIEFDSALPEVQTKEWTTQCQEREADPKKKNPFFNEKATISDAQVQLKLAQEEKATLEKMRLGTATKSTSGAYTHDEISPSMLVHKGLELEDLQRRHRIDVASITEHSTSLQRAKVVERSNALRRKVDSWIEIQHLYLPITATIRARQDAAGGGAPVAAEDIALLLPSMLRSMGLSCDLSFFKFEFELRLAQAGTTLDELRGLLIMKSQIKVESRITETADKYRSTRSKLSLLSNVVMQYDWLKTFQELHDVDITGLTSMDDDTPEGRKKLTWIWNVQGPGETHQENHFMSKSTLCDFGD
ncbi:hypothetical protein CPC08DRAFT_769836 [Agrocybe pediades]|nr:hypothetical protein CPC08DRAFT_769836 [Agrocybe pediades]